MDSKVEILGDRLAELPDTILLHILSFLPTSVAVRTMLLKPFGTLWTLLPNLDFDDSLFYCYYTTPETAVAVAVADTVSVVDADTVSVVDAVADAEECTTVNREFFNFVQNILSRHSRPKLARFRVNISEAYYSDIEQANLTHELDSWVDFALRKDVEILEFNVGMVEPDELLYKLPYTEFVSDSVTELKLEFLEIKQQTRFQMGLLRVLRLIRVEISDSVLHGITEGCPLLQELEIYNCFSLGEVRIDAANVEKLILDTSEHYGFGPIVHCPNLKSFWFTGFVNCITVQDLSSLVDVRFDLGSHFMEFNAFEQFMMVLKPVLNAKFVSFSCEFVTVLFYCAEKHLPEMSMNWKRAELRLWLTEKHVPGLSRMLKNSPYLKELVIDIAHWHRHFLEPIESKLSTCNMDNEEDRHSTSLKTIVIYNASMCSYTCLVHLICSLLENATVLAALAIHYKHGEESPYESVLSTEEWAEFSTNLPTFPKASQHVTVTLF